MPAPSRGVLVQKLVAPGSHVSRGQPVAIVACEDADAATGEAEHVQQQVVAERLERRRQRRRNVAELARFARANRGADLEPLRSLRLLQSLDLECNALARLASRAAEAPFFGFSCCTRQAAESWCCSTLTMVAILEKRSAARRK